MKTEYQTKIISILLAFISVIFFLLLSIFLSLVIGLLLKAPIIGSLGFIIAASYVHFFRKKILTYFIHNYLLEFDNTSFSLTRISSGKNLFSKRRSIKWSDIKSYKFNFGGSKNTILTLYLKNNTKKIWTFIDNKNFEAAVTTESVFSLFRSYVQGYNADNDLKDRIYLNKGFSNSKTGSILIFLTLIIILIGFLIQLKLHSKSSVFTLIVGLGITFQQLIGRKNSKEIYEKIKKLDKH
jgi:hypothetical protein